MRPTIRAIQPSELDICFRGGYEFFREGNLPGGFNQEVFKASWTTLIQKGIGQALCAFSGDGVVMGLLAFIVAPDLWNGDRVAIECAWFMLPEHRGGRAALMLLDDFERRAKEAGCVRAAMIHLESLSPVELERLYARKGYVLTEKHYVKTL